MLLLNRPETELAGLGGDAFHFRHHGNCTKFLPLYLENINLALGVDYGLNVPLRDSKSYISDRFFLGSISQVRGFKAGGNVRKVTV